MGILAPVAARSDRCVRKQFSILSDYVGLPPRLVRYLLGVSLAGPIAAFVWMSVADSDLPPRWLALAVLTALACVAERFPIQLTHKTYISVATAVYVAMLLALPLPVTGVAALAAAIGAQVLRRLTGKDRGIAEGLFNVGQTALYVTGSAIVLSAADHAAISSPAIGDISLIHLLTASISLHLLNTALVAGASARHLGTGTRQVWQRNVLIDGGPHVGMTLVGLCAAQLAIGSPLLIPALAVPAILVHRAVTASVQLRQNVRLALESLVDIVELRDPYTAGHSRRVAEYARSIAEAMGLTAEEADAIQAAGHVHDLGKVAIDPAVLLKPGKLDDAEWAEMRRERAGDHAQRQQCAVDHRRRHQQQDDRDELRGARSDPPPGLESELGEDVDRLRRGGELEEERLREDRGDRETHHPARDALRPREAGRRHGSTPIIFGQLTSARAM